MKILVTGATGFVGNHVIQKLLKLGCDVIATSRDIERASRFSWFNKVTYLSADLNDNKKNYFEYFKEPDVLIHLAWEGLPNYKDLFHFEKNLFSNYFFLKNIIENGLKNLTVTGTCSEYGMQNGELSENMEAKPNTPYGFAKDTLRKFLEQLKMKIDFKLKWVRLFYMYGEGEHPDSIFSQLDKALQNKDKVFNMSSGEQVRDYLPVEKAAEYIIKIAFQEKIDGIINCCSENPISMKKMVENYLKKKGQTNSHKIRLYLGYYPYRDYEPMVLWGDNKKLKQVLGE